MKHLLASMSGACLCFVLTACVDDKYDLGDVDTTVKVPVKDLSLKVNIDPIELENIFNLKDDSPVKVVNGEYAINKSGKFESTDIKVDNVVLDSPKLQSSETTINLAGAATPTATTANEIRYNLSSEQRNIDFSSSFVSSYITDVAKLGCDMSLTMNVSIAAFNNIVSHIDYKNVTIQLPKGLLDITVNNVPGVSYNSETGLLLIPSVQGTGSAISLVINTSGIDFAYLKSINNASFTPAADQTGNGSISMSGQFYIVSGEAVILKDYIKATSATALPTQATMRVDYNIPSITVNSFSGSILYIIDEVNIPDVALSDMPDVLAQESTVIGLQNPQIYLTITNPLKDYKLSAVTGMKITAKRAGKEDKTVILDEPIELDPAKSSNGEFRFCLSPSNPAVKMAGYEDAEWLKYSELGNVIAGEGVPDALEIDLINPRIPDQYVDNFELGNPIGTVNGNYDFIAPLGITEGSQIIYTDNVDGWQSEDLDRVTIESLDVNLNISTNIPIELTLTGYPVNAAGERLCDASGKPLSIDGANIPAMAQNKNVTLHVSGVIPENSNLDGIHFEAKGTVPDQNSPVLSPEMTITITDIRPTVSGYYIKEL